VANIDLWGLQKVTANPEYYLYEGLRQMEQAMVSIVDNIKAAFGSKTPLASKKIQTRNMSSEMTSGIKNTTTINSNLSEIFDPGNYTVGEGKYEGPSLVSVKNETTEYSDVKMKGSKGPYQASLSHTKTSDGGSSTTLSGGLGIGKATASIFISDGSSSKSKNTQKVGVEVSIPYTNKTEKSKPSIFFMNIYFETK